MTFLVLEYSSQIDSQIDSIQGFLFKLNIVVFE